MVNRVKFLGLLFAFTAVVGIAPGVAMASQGSGKVTVFEITGTSFVRINLGEGLVFSGRPACHNAFFPNSYAFDYSTNKGRALLSTVQAAMLAGKVVFVTGGTTCNTLPFGQIETAQSLQVTP